MYYGMNFGNKPMMQPYIEINHGSLSYANWTNYNMKENKTEEIDHTLKINANLPIGNNDNIKGSASISLYTFPNSTMEDEPALASEFTYTGETLPVDINLKVEKLLKSEKGKGKIFSFDLSKTIPINENISVSAKIGTAFNEEYFSNNSGWTHTYGSLNISSDLGKNFNASITGTYQKKLDKEFKGLVKSEPYFQATISKSIN